MRECRTYGSVRGARSNARPYRVLPARGPADRITGRLHAEQPTLRNEAIGPARLIRTANIGEGKFPEPHHR